MTLTRIARTFLSGLAVVLPIFITIAVVLWVLNAVESALGTVVQLVLPQGDYPRGAGLLLALVLVFGIGILMEAVYFRRLLAWVEDHHRRFSGWIE